MCFLIFIKNINKYRLLFFLIENNSQLSDYKNCKIKKKQYKTTEFLEKSNIFPI